MTIWIKKEQAYKVAAIAYRSEDGRVAVNEGEREDEALEVAFRPGDSDEAVRENGWAYVELDADGNPKTIT